MAQVAVTKKIKNRTKQAPGAGVSEIIRRSIVVKKSDPVLSTDTTAVNLFELPGNVLVLDAYVRVTTAFDGTGTSAAATATLTMPNDTGTEVLWDAGALGLNSTGFKPSTNFGVTPASGGMVILNYTPNTTQAGQLEVYLSYVEFEDEL